MKTSFRSIQIVALSLTVGLFAATPAMAAPGNVERVRGGTLVAKGAGVNVSYDIICSSGFRFAAEVSVIQKIGGGRTASGSDVTPDYQPCTGDIQNVTTLVPTDNQAFKVGSALSTIRLFICDTSSNCGKMDPFSQEFRIANK